MPVIGGVIVAFMAKYGTGKIKGHGIPEAMEAVLINRSRIEPRVAILKPISAAIAIGTGGPFGAEGPIIQTGGAVGSLVGQVFHTTAAERKGLLACGAAAGMSAKFNTPIAGVILAIELLLFEFKSRSFILLVIASTLATAVHMQFLGAGPMFTVTPMDFGIPRALPFYLILCVICGLAPVGFSRLLYWTEDQFEKLPIDELWWPAIGALGLGINGYFVPHDQRHLEREPRAQTLDHCDDRKGDCPRDLVGIGDLRRVAGTHVHVERSARRGIRDWHKPFVLGRELVTRSICPGRHGRGFRRSVARDVLVHNLRL